jgi:solute carrier family 45 protein 1/2/4
VLAVASLFNQEYNPNFTQTWTLIFAAICVYGMNLAIQPVQGGMRALFVDVCPTEQLDEASAWAARMTGIGNLLGYASGFVNLPRMFPLFGDTQFKVFCVLASCTLTITITTMCLVVKERDSSNDLPPDVKLSSIAGKFRHISSSFFRMPPRVMEVCKVQFAAWSAWFLFLYYITT